MERCTAPVFAASNGLVCLFMLIALSFALLALILLVIILSLFSRVSLEPYRCRIARIQFRIANCGRGNTDPTVNVRLDLDAWLSARPAIANALVWETTAGVETAYPDWTADEKTDLAKACARLRRGASTGIPETPPLDVFLVGTRVWSTNLAADLAWRYYLAHVAQSLMAEERGWLPWSLGDYPAADLAHLFDSRSLFHWRGDLDRYSIVKLYTISGGVTADLGTATPGDPGRTFAYLDSGGLIGASRLETIERVLDWCTAHLVHYEGGEDQSNLENHWQFGGFPPVERMIHGTVRDDRPDYGLQHWTAGCWGTTAFLRAVLRTVNIPVKGTRLRCPGSYHETPRFAGEDLYLSHGDDPYGKLAHATPPVPASELLIDQAQFDAWFGPAVPDDVSCDNVGRRRVEVSVEYLPNNVLRRHCDDVAAGRDHAASRVYASFDRYYTVADLEAVTLWDRIDAKIAGFGGCDQIPTSGSLYDE